MWAPPGGCAADGGGTSPAAQSSLHAMEQLPRLASPLAARQRGVARIRGGSGGLGPGQDLLGTTGLVEAVEHSDEHVAIVAGHLEALVRLHEERHEGVGAERLVGHAAEERELREVLSHPVRDVRHVRDGVQAAPGAEAEGILREERGGYHAAPEVALLEVRVREADEEPLQLVPDEVVGQALHRVGHHHPGVLVGRRRLPPCGQDALLHKLCGLAADLHAEDRHCGLQLGDGHH
mmetsp:Transcript_22055/g.74205  ORF Transcript_22055/g.74205 Transcript_22055/m.74205 type:complete len:235 (+) Transcript_22055:86-790(+)